MARKIGVIEPGAQRISSHIKKTVALLLIRRAIAEWEQVNVSIRKRALREQPRELPQECVPTGVYVPDWMPPREISGCKFEDPLQLSHRMPRFRPHRAQPDVSLSVTS